MTVSQKQLAANKKNAQQGRQRQNTLPIQF